MKLSHLPQRTSKPRETGCTMVMDKGLSSRQAEDMLAVCSSLIDVVKLGFGTSLFSQDLEKKLSAYREAGIPYFYGGTLMEAAWIRGEIDEFKSWLNKTKAEWVEVSDGSLEVDHDKKCEMIKDFAKDFRVLSEVGSKNPAHTATSSQWIAAMNAELAAGSWKVIGEARESGNVGVFNEDGGAKSDLVSEILAGVPNDKILWEAPQKSQQIYFIEKAGFDVNLGNIAPADVIPLETLRNGLRGDTFELFLPKELFDS